MVPLSPNSTSISVFRRSKCSVLKFWLRSYKILNFRKWFMYGLKAQKLLAQGSALGIMAIGKAPCKGKSLINC